MATGWQIGGAGLNLAGGLISGLGAYQQGQHREAMYDFNARQNFMDAKIATQNADARARALRKHGHKLTGAQKTRYSKAGVRLEGTPLEVMAKTIENVELDAIATRQQGRFEAAQHRAQGKFNKEMADASAKAGTIGAIGGILGGLGGAVGMFA